MYDKILDCNTPKESLFGNILKSDDIFSKKISYLCSDYETMFDIFDLNNLGIPTKEETDNCIKTGKEMYILSFYENSNSYFSNFIKDSRQIYPDILTRLHDLGLSIYRISIEIKSSDSGTSEKYVLEDAFVA